MDALTTYGLTAVLLARGLGSYVEIAQVASLAVVYVIAWRPLARHKPPEPWMAMALLVFSMTTLWPVLYIYFDVWVLSIAALMASLWHSAGSKRLQHSVVLLLMAAGIAVGGIVAAAAARPGSSYTIDVGGTAASSLTGGGFGRDEPSYEDSRAFVWVNDTTARVRLPRAGWTSADIQIDIRPFEPVAGLRQTVAASLNGKSIGLARLRSGWQTVTFHAPFRHWHYGFNLLDLNFAYAMPDPSSRRDLSVGIDTIEVR